MSRVFDILRDRYQRELDRLWSTWHSMPAEYKRFDYPLESVRYEAALKLLAKLQAFSMRLVLCMMEARTHPTDTERRDLESIGAAT